MLVRMDEARIGQEVPAGGSSAALDLGSNMFRMVVGRVSNLGAVEVLEKVSSVVSLARGMGTGGRIRDDAIERAEAVIRRFRSALDARRIQRVRAVGTGAFRAASNRAVVLERLESALGAGIEVISGEREAGLALDGVRSEAGGDGELALLDIGGVSTEVVVVTSRATSVVTAECGVITLSDWVEAGGASRGGVEVMKRRAAELLRPLSALPEIGAMRCFAAGGAAVALVAHRDGLPYCEYVGDGTVALDRAELDRLFEDYSRAPAADRASRIGVSEEHGNLIPAGYAILAVAMDALRLSRIVPTGRGVAEGLLRATVKEERSTR